MALEVEKNGLIDVVLDGLIDVVRIFFLFRTFQDFFFLKIFVFDPPATLKPSDNKHGYAPDLALL